MSNNATPEFPAEEVMTTYLFGIMRKQPQITEIYEYVLEHLSPQFPNLPSYAGYV